MCIIFVIRTYPIVWYESFYIIFIDTEKYGGQHCVLHQALGIENSLLPLNDKRCYVLGVTYSHGVGRGCILIDVDHLWAVLTRSWLRCLVLWHWSTTLQRVYWSPVVDNIWFYCLVLAWPWCPSKIFAVAAYFTSLRHRITGIWPLVDLVASKQWRQTVAIWCWIAITAAYREACTHGIRRCMALSLRVYMFCEICTRSWRLELFWISLATKHGINWSAIFPGASHLWMYVIHWSWTLPCCWNDDCQRLSSTLKRAHVTLPGYSNIYLKALLSQNSTEVMTNSNRGAGPFYRPPTKWQR